MTGHRPPLSRTALAVLAAALTLLIAVPGALGGKPRTPAHAAASYMTGIGDEQQSMFTNPLWTQLHMRVVRYIAPYDAAVRGDELTRAKQWIAAAEAAHQQILVAFYHSEHTPTVLPSVAAYQHDVAKFVKDFPRIHQFQAWDEANRGNIPHALASPSAPMTAKYYQALIRSCHDCQVIGLDVLDAYDISGTVQYISEFKKEIGKLRTVMPRIWGLHNYSDINRLESWRTRDLVRDLGGQVWLTETGGIVQFGGAFPNRHGSGISRAAKVLRYMFSLAGALSQVKRLYIYDWTGGNSHTRFDAGLMNARQQPRAGYVIVCRALHAAKCGVKTVSN